MKIVFPIITLFLFNISLADNAIWFDGSAKTLPKGRYEMGIFQPLRYGLNKSTELVTHPLIGFIMPNIAIKKTWGDYCCYDFATRHGLTYPTLLLKSIARKGTGGFLPYLSTIPQIFTFNNQVILTKSMSDDHWVTTKMGFIISLKAGKMDMVTIDFPLIYPRTITYHSGLAFNLGIDFDGKLYKKLDYNLDIDIFLLNTPTGNYAFEHKAMIIWKRNSRFAILVGYKLIYGEYPYGPDPYNPRIIPLIDLQWGRGGKELTN